MTLQDPNVKYFSVDIEASGPIPGEYSMLSIGACEVGNTNNGFYAVLQPISEKYVPKALEVCGLSMDTVRLAGQDPNVAMKIFEDWILLTSNGKHPKFVGFNEGFDWQFVNYYFMQFLGRNPFGISGIDIKSMWYAHVLRWGDTSKSKIKRALQLNLKHTHNALEDAVEQAVIFETMVDFFKNTDVNNRKSNVTKMRNKT